MRKGASSSVQNVGRQRRWALARDLCVIGAFGVLASFAMLLLLAMTSQGISPADVFSGGMLAPVIAAGMTLVLLALAPRTCPLPLATRLVVALGASAAGALLALWFLWPV